MLGSRRAKSQHTDTHSYPGVLDDKSYTPGPTPEQGLNVAMHRPLSSTWPRSEPIQSPCPTWRSRSLRRATTPFSRTSLSLTPWHGRPRAHPKYLETEASAFSLRAKPAVAGLRPSGDCQGVEGPCPQKQDAPAKHVSLPLALRLSFRFHLSLFQSHGADLPSRLGVYFCAALLELVLYY